MRVKRTHTHAQAWNKSKRDSEAASYASEEDTHTCRVGQNHMNTVYIRYFWQGNHQIYGHIWCIYTVLANPTHMHRTRANQALKMVEQVMELGFNPDASI